MPLQTKFDFYEKKLKKILSRERFEHSLRVVETALKYASGLKIDNDKLILSALIHDRAKELPEDKLAKISVENNRPLELAEKINPVLLHGPVGAIIIKNEWEIFDREILRAVKCHTTACPEMGMIEKIVFLADCLEPNRDYPEANELREIAREDIELAFRKTIDYTIWHVVKKGWALHPSTVKARNHILYHDKARGQR